MKVNVLFRSNDVDGYHPIDLMYKMGPGIANSDIYSAYKKIADIGVPVVQPMEWEECPWEDLLDLQKRKYEFNRAVINDNFEGERYLSGNEIKGLFLEAHSYAESIRLIGLLPSKMKLSDNKLVNIITSSEEKCAGLIRKAEDVRGSSSRISDITVKQQARINRAMITSYLREQGRL